MAIDDEGLLRLGRLALAIISDVDRRPFVSALTTAYLAEALMQHPDRLDLCSWIIRTSQVDLWPLLEPDVRRFIQVGLRPRHCRPLTDCWVALGQRVPGSCGVVFRKDSFQYRNPSATSKQIHACPGLRGEARTVLDVPRERMCRPTSWRRTSRGV